jgi:hypothetical protein
MSKQDKATKPRNYYTLLVKRDNLWSPQFGDYDKEVVKDEEYDCYDTEKTRIICTKDDQVSIDAAVKVINSVK